MADTSVVYKTGASVGNILATNEVAANTPPAPVTPTPETPVVPVVQPPAATITPESPVVPVETPAATPTPETPAIPTPEVPEEKNKSVISFEAFDDKPIVPATPEAPATPITDWKEQIKNNPQEALKELGIADFALELTEHIKNGGDPTDYINAKFIDYNKITDETLVKADLQKQYPTFSPEQIALMFNRKYSVAEDADQEDKDFANLQLKADAHNSRQGKITEQQKFKIPAAIEKTDDSGQSQIEVEQLREEARRWFNEHEATKALMTSKRVTLNLGENGSFNFDVLQPDFVTRAIQESKVWQKLTSTKSGEPDVSKMQKLVLYAADPQKFENDLVNYGKTLALPGVVAEGQNIVPPHKVIPMTAENKDKPDWGAAKTGRVGG